MDISVRLLECINQKHGFWFFSIFLIVLFSKEGSGEFGISQAYMKWDYFPPTNMVRNLKPKK